MKAHDVRHLCLCIKCEKLGDSREMIGLTKHWHPKCYYEASGDAGVLSLHSKDQAKFRLCDIPHDLMKRLLDDISGEPRTFPLLFTSDWLEQKIKSDPDLDCEARSGDGRNVKILSSETTIVTAKVKK